MKKYLTHTIVIAAAAAPIIALAQQSAPVPATRAQVKNDIIRLEGAGYSPAGSNIDYPGAVQAAEARTAEQTREAVTTTYGGKAAGSTASGSRAPASPKSLYLENANSLYVGD
ncbi:DUF4148 domain-containing protein [Trinickia sp.]|uniref:DUF4148 domain-containing protein n=1 Tax=Trinickia sp. TaxID=2571163 RepID=UPI003F7D6922